MPPTERAERTTEKYPGSAWILIALILLLGIMAAVCGAMLFLAPDGHLMGLSTSVLEKSPFPDYLVPGIMLFIFFGVFPLVVGAGLVKTDWKGLGALNPFGHHHWSWTGSVVGTIILLTCIITATVLVGYVSILQPVMGAWGLVILLFTALPGIRKYYAA
jgi:hypothetical protein